MRLKIISDGVPQNTRVIDVESGRRVEGVKRIEWEIGVEQVGTALIEVIEVPVDIEVDVDDD